MTWMQGVLFTIGFRIQASGLFRVRRVELAGLIILPSQILQESLSLPGDTYLISDMQLSCDSGVYRLEVSVQFCSMQCLYSGLYVFNSQ